ncbi:MAG: hypothetical protein HYY84_03140 [Deltaproteobacteria bacterium]|nr:hypothetical protein [Deltaproteobacteria bacterium]
MTNSERVVAELRERLRGTAPRGHGHLSTGLAALDELLGGGFPEGRLVEVVGGQASCATSVAVQALAAATRRGEVVAYIDWPDAFDPRSAAGAGLDLARTLWVRPQTVKDAIAATDLVLGAGGFGVVALDLFGEKKKCNHDYISSSSFLRLARAAERAKTTFLVIAAEHVAGTFAALTLTCGRACVAIERSKGFSPGRTARVDFRSPRIQ